MIDLIASQLLIINELMGNHQTTVGRIMDIAYFVCAMCLLWELLTEEHPFNFKEMDENGPNFRSVSVSCSLGYFGIITLVVLIVQLVAKLS
jgi:hypothetical protein